MKDMISIHRMEYEEEPEVIVSAPGVVSVMGDHSDYNHSLVLPFALNRTAQIAVSRRKDNSLRFFAADAGERKRTSVSNLKYKREDRWANYMKGAINSLLQLGCPVRGLNITVSSDIPQQIGLGSSAAITIATTMAVKTLYGFSLSDLQVVHCARQAESGFMGRQNSITAPLVSLTAREGNALFIDTRSLDYRQVPVDFDGALFLIANSHVPLTPTDGEYLQRNVDCRTCVDILSQRKSGSSLRDYSAQDLRERMGDIPESVRRICLHVIEENGRVLDAEETLRRRDPVSFGKLMNRSHESLRDLYEVSCPELDWLVKRALETDGVYGSRMTGAGFGGCTISLIREDSVAEYIKRLDEYERIFGFKPEVFASAPSRGARVVHLQKSE